MLKSFLEALSERIKTLCLRINEQIEFGENVAHVLFLLKSAVEKSAVQKAAVQKAAVEDENNH